MLIDIPFIADWKKIRENRQKLTNLNTAHENEGMIDYDYQVGQKIFLRHDGILCKAESRYHKVPWMIISVQINQIIRVQYRNKSEWMNIWRVRLLEE
jgi:hypothetical protein